MPILLLYASVYLHERDRSAHPRGGLPRFRPRRRLRRHHPRNRPGGPGQRGDPFRYFKNKNELLRQVILQKSRNYEHVFAGASFASPDDLRRTVEAYARVHVRELRENEDFVRTFFGELSRHPKLCRRLFLESAKQVRQKFIVYLQGARKRGLVRRDLDPVTAADGLSGMLLAGVLRRPLTEPEYSNESYSAHCVELFLRGIEK